MESTLPLRFSARRIWIASSSVTHIGFSSSTCTPASSASIAHSACVRLYVHTLTQSSRSFSSISL